MALKIVKSGPVTRRGVVSPGSGWVNVTGGDPNNSSNPYWFGHSGYCLMTVTAWNVDGLRVLEWGKDRFLESRFPGAAHSISGVLDLSQRSAVVRALNPTDKAEIVINWVPLSLSLSLSLVNALTAFVRRCSHGAKASEGRAGYGIGGDRVSAFPTLVGNMEGRSSCVGAVGTRRRNDSCARPLSGRSHHGAIADVREFKKHRHPRPWRAYIVGRNRDVLHEPELDNTGGTDQVVTPVGGGC